MRYISLILSVLLITAPFVPAQPGGMTPRKIHDPALEADLQLQLKELCEPTLEEILEWLKENTPNVVTTMSQQPYFTLRYENSDKTWYEFAYNEEYLSQAQFTLTTISYTDYRPKYDWGGKHNQYRRGESVLYFNFADFDLERSELTELKEGIDMNDSRFADTYFAVTFHTRGDKRVITTNGPLRINTITLFFRDHNKALRYIANFNHAVEFCQAE